MMSISNPFLSPFICSLKFIPMILDWCSTGVQNTLFHVNSNKMTDLWVCVCVCVDCFGSAFEGTRLESIESNNNNKKRFLERCKNWNSVWFKSEYVAGDSFEKLKCYHSLLKESWLGRYVFVISPTLVTIKCA